MFKKKLISSILNYYQPVYDGFIQSQNIRKVTWKNNAAHMYVKSPIVLMKGF